MNRMEKILKQKEKRKKMYRKFMKKDKRCYQQ